MAPRASCFELFGRIGREGKLNRWMMTVTEAIWGWQPAMYLFLGGTGAGTYVVAASLYLLDQKNHVSIIRYATRSALVCLVAGLLLLLLDLSDPWRGVLLWRSFVNPSSWMTIGVWGMAVAVVVFLCSSVLSVRRLAVRTCAVRKVFFALGIVLSLFAATYTGMLLGHAKGVPFWNTGLIPVLFLASSLGAGIALVEVIALLVPRGRSLKPRAFRLLGLATLVIVLAEAVLLAAFIMASLNADSASAIGAATVSSAAELVFGGLSQPFWIAVVIIGLVLPAGASAACLKRGWGESRSLRMLGSAGALLGGMCLRYLILSAGTHADLVGFALGLGTI